MIYFTASDVQCASGSLLPMLLYSSSFCWTGQAGPSANLPLGALISKLSLEVWCWTALYIEPGFSPSAIAAFVKAPLRRFASPLWACETLAFWWQQSSGQNLAPVL